MWKKHKIVVLLTNDASFIQKNRYLEETEENNFNLNQHLYVLSYEEIKEGDWFIWDNDNSVQKAVSDSQDYTNCYGNDSFDISISAIGNEAKKVIASTDKSLSLPSPTDEFLKEWFNNPVEEIETLYSKCSCVVIGDCYNPDLDSCDKKYSLDITDGTINCRFIQTEDSWDDISKQCPDILMTKNQFLDWLKENYKAPKPKPKTK